MAVGSPYHSIVKMFLLFFYPNCPNSFSEHTVVNHHVCNFRSDGVISLVQIPHRLQSRQQSPKNRRLVIVRQGTPFSCTEWGGVGRLVFSLKGINGRFYHCLFVDFASYKGIRILESKKFLPVESRIQENLLVQSGILGFGTWNTAQGIRTDSH